MGSVGFCEMLYRCNLFAMVSGGSRPKFAENTVLVYDDAKKRSVLEFTFRQAVIAVRCRRDRLVAVLLEQIHVFSFPNNPQKLLTIPTRPNPLGLCELSPGLSNLLIFPGSKVGSLHLVVSLIPTALLPFLREIRHGYLMLFLSVELDWV